MEIDLARRRARLVLWAALAALGFIAGVVFIGCAFMTPVHRLPPTQVTQLMPESTPEWLEVQHKDPVTGRVTATEVQFRNGDRGVRLWRPNKTLAEQTITDPAGRQLMHAVYADDGKQIVGGFAIRHDGLPVWNVTRDGNLVTTTVFWQDGKTPFAVKKRNVGGDRLDEMYFFPEGGRWMHYVGFVDKSKEASLEEIWNRGGTRIFAHLAGLNDTSTDFFYRDDGTLKYQQWWAVKTFCFEEGCSSPTRVLLQAEVMQADGDRPARDMIMTDDGTGSVKRVRDTSTDNSAVDYTLLYDQTIESTTTYDSGGRVIATTPGGKGKEAQKLNVDQSLLASHLTDLSPVKTWRAQEKPEDALVAFVP